MSLFDWAVNNLGSKELQDKRDKINALSAKDSFTEPSNSISYRDKYKSDTKSSSCQETKSKTSNSDSSYKGESYSELKVQLENEFPYVAQLHNAWVNAFNEEHAKLSGETDS